MTASTIAAAASWIAFLGILIRPYRQHSTLHGWWHHATPRQTWTPAAWASACSTSLQRARERRLTEKGKIRAR